MLLPIVSIFQLTVAIVLPPSDNVKNTVETCRSEWLNGNTVIYKNNTLCFKGVIDESSLEVVSQGIDEIDTLRYIVIDSPGGEVESALAIADLILMFESSFIIDGACLSSCANYLLPAAKYRYIFGDSIVGWHGGPPRTFDELLHMVRVENSSFGDDEVIRFAEELQPTMQAFIKRQSNLYNVVSISSNVIYDLDIMHKCLTGLTKDDVNEIARRTQSAFWSPSVYTLTNYYGFSHLVHIGKSRNSAFTDKVHIRWLDGGIENFFVDEVCMQNAFSERDGNESISIQFQNRNYEPGIWPFSSIIIPTKKIK